MARFSELTREWFTGTFAAPTAAQTEAWDAIADGHNTLVIAPTGSGKTLAAFLWAIDRLASGKAEVAATGSSEKGTRVLYVSPLKALAVDVERNLSTPLTGIGRVAERRGVAAPSITVGVRSGDTPPNRRREMIARPPDVLITTPESLFLMLTSAARETLAEVETVIVDEVHAVAATKRGAHLALSLERLDQLMDARAADRALGHRPATGGGRPVPVRARHPPPSWRRWPRRRSTCRCTCRCPTWPTSRTTAIWPDVEERIVDLIESHRSSIVFANSRRLAERLTARLNEIHAERLGVRDSPRRPIPRWAAAFPRR